MRKWIGFVLTVVFILGWRPPLLLAQSPDVEITIDEIIASGFEHPLQVTHAGDGSGRLFVVERTGRIRIIEDGAVLGQPFLDISALVETGHLEQGLLGLAFHPDYENNGYLYVDYTRQPDGATVVARYSVSTADANRVDSTTAITLLTIAQPYDNHNGGQLMFGSDGYLYIGTGDGGSAGDPHNNAQAVDSLLGKLLRINVDGELPYVIPPDNLKGGAEEVWAFGLRNPWRFSFDRKTGDLYIGDVGQNAWEEVDYLPAGTAAGVNFGWRCKEGTHLYNFSEACQGLTLTDPIAEYSHETGRSVTGGFVYRGSLYPALVGRYFYADFSTGKIWSIYQTGSNSWTDPDLELDTALRISAFGEDEQGELYVVEFDFADGKIRRLADLQGAGPDLSSSAKRVAPVSVDPGRLVTYTIAVRNTGGAVAAPISLTDTLPAGLTYLPGSLQATAGTVDDSRQPLLTWQGSPGLITVTYQATATGAVTGSLVNRAELDGQILEAALFVPSPTLTPTLADYFLPGIQPGQLADSIPDSAGCDFCHTAPIYDKWRGSVMSHSARDPLLWTALANANHYAPAAGEYCLRCHTAQGWLEGRSHPATGADLQTGDIHNGVACEVCHRLVDPVPGSSDEAAAIDSHIRAALTSTVPISHPASAMMIVDPQDRRRGPFALEPAPPHPNQTFQTDLLGQGGNPITQARLCGTCHNVDNPLLSWDGGRGQYWPNQMGLAAASFEQGELFPIETTYDEWLYSQYAAGGVDAPRFQGDKPDGLIQSCQDCHMPRLTGQAAADFYNPVERDCVTTGCLPEHTFAGANAWLPGLLSDTRWRFNTALQTDEPVRQAESMLQRAATLTVTLQTSGSRKIATVRVINQAGHKLPTGYPEGRRMWLHLRAYDENDTLLYESGAHDAATGQLTIDPDIKVYEAKQGLTPELAARLGLPAGASFHFILNNTVIKDNRIPPRGYTVSAFDKPGLQPVGASYQDGQYWDDTIYTLPLETERVSATLYYQTASKEYIDFLRARGGSDGETLGRLWDDSKSEPVVMALAFFPSEPGYLPLIFK